jgi:hypothetical protein
MRVVLPVSNFAAIKKVLCSEQLRSILIIAGFILPLAVN